MQIGCQVHDKKGVHNQNQIELQAQLTCAYLPWRYYSGHGWDLEFHSFSSVLPKAQTIKDTNSNTKTVKSPTMKSDHTGTRPTNIRNCTKHISRSINIIIFRHTTRIFTQPTLLFLTNSLNNRLIIKIHGFPLLFLFSWSITVCCNGKL